MSRLFRLYPYDMWEIKQISKIAKSNEDVYKIIYGFVDDDYSSGEIDIWISKKNYNAVNNNQLLAVRGFSSVDIWLINNKLEIVPLHSCDIFYPYEQEDFERWKSSDYFTQLLKDKILLLKEYN